MQVTNFPILRACLYAAFIGVSLIGGCRKEVATPRDSLVRGTWVLYYYTVQQTGGGMPEWYSLQSGDTRDYLDFHADGSVESGDSWNGARTGSYELTGETGLKMLVSSRPAAISARIVELSEEFLSLTEEYNVGTRRVVNRYQYYRR